MLTAACWLYVSMIGCWLAAACVGGSAMWMRWVLLAATLPAVALAWVSASRHVRPARVVMPLALLVGYGLVLGVASESPGLAIAKCVAFGATTFACVLGAPLLVERYGRDRLLAAWRLAWRCLLLLSIVAVASGRWGDSVAGLYGPTSNPNMFGSLLVTVGAILFLVPPGGTTRGPLFFLEVAVLVALLLATRCRSALLAVSAAAVVAILSERGTRRWTWSALIIAAGIGVVLVMPTTSVAEIERVVRKTPVDLSRGGAAPEVLSTRAPIWEHSWRAMVGALPFGLGWGVKEDAPKTWTLDVQSLGYGREEGTSWLPVGEELGLPGLALVAWLWMAAFRVALRQPHRVRILAMSSLTILFVIACFEGWFLTPGNWESMAFWSSIGILLATPAPTHAPDRRLEPRFLPAATAAS